MANNIIQMKWKRPDSIEYPKVWYRFKARDSNTEELVEYRIEDLMEPRAEDAYHHMKENYLKDEPMSQALGGYNNTEHFEDYQYGWKSILAQKMPLVCYRQGSDEIVGINWVFVTSEEDNFLGKLKENCKSAPFDAFLGALFLLNKNFNVFKHYGVNKYLASLSLSVDNRFRGRAIGDHFMAAREMVCKEFGIKLTHTVYTSNFSSRNAENVGFKTDVRMSYADVMKAWPKYDLSGVKSAEISLKTRVY